MLLGGLVGIERYLYIVSYVCYVQCPDLVNAGNVVIAGHILEKDQLTAHLADQRAMIQMKSRFVLMEVVSAIFVVVNL